MPNSPSRAAPGDPYCGNCGYALVGLEDSSKCPECGKPIVQVLMRPEFGVKLGKRFRSKATLFGLPVIDIALGPSGKERYGKAKGIIAIGDFALGWLAFGGVSCGIVSIGGCSLGLFAIGGAGAGLLTALGGLAMSTGIAAGGAAIGTIANGGGAIGLVAQGGGAIGRYTRDGQSLGAPTPPIFERLSWLFGHFPPTLISALQPMLIVLGITLCAATLIALVALWRIKQE